MRKGNESLSARRRRSRTGFVARADGFPIALEIITEALHEIQLAA